MSSVSHTLDPVEAAKGDVDRSRRLIAETLDDLSLHHSWLETYHREERRRAERLRRREALERLALRRQRAAFVLRRFAVRTYAAARAGLKFAVATSLSALTAVRSFFRWAAPRASRLAKQTITQLSAASSSSAAWTWDKLCLVSAKSYRLLESGFLWSVRASDEAGLVFRRKVWRFAFVPAARLGREAAHITAPARRRAGIFWTRTWIKIRRQTIRLFRRFAMMEIRPSINADGMARRGRRVRTRMRIVTRPFMRHFQKTLAGTATSIHVALKRASAASAIGWARTRIVTRSVARRFKRRFAGTTDAIKTGWRKGARTASVQLARTNRTAAAFERRAVETLIRSGPRMGRFLAQHTPAQFGTKPRGHALIVRPNTAVVCTSETRTLMPPPHTA